MAKEKDGGRIEVEDGLLSAGFVQLPILLARDPNLTAGAKLVYVALLWYHWRGQDYPGQRQMAEDFGFSERSARTYLHELERDGYLESRRPGLQQVNTYVLRSLRPANFAGQERQLLPFPLEQQDSVLILTESEAAAASSPSPPVASDRSDSDFELVIGEVTAALAIPRQRKQLVSLAQREGWQPDIIRQATATLAVRIAEGYDAAKPGAVLTAMIRYAMSQQAERQTEANEQERRAVDLDRAIAVSMVRDRRSVGHDWPMIERELTRRLSAELATWALETVQGEPDRGR